MVRHVDAISFIQMNTLYVFIVRTVAYSGGKKRRQAGTITWSAASVEARPVPRSHWSSPHQLLQSLPTSGPRSPTILNDSMITSLVGYVYQEN